MEVPNMAKDDVPNIDHWMIADAMIYAMEAHANVNQIRIGGGPYIVHPFRVFSYLMYRLGVFDQTILTAALLHDVIEDTNHIIGDIEEKFGAKVAKIVMELTNDKTLPRLERKAKMIEKAKTISEDAKVIKVADRIDNLTGAKTEFRWERYLQYIEESDKLCNSLKEGLTPSSSGSLLLGLSILEKLIKDCREETATR